MDLQQLQAMGGFAPTKIHKREVKVARPVQRPAAEWADPEVPEFTGETVSETITVHIRPGTSADLIEVVRADARERPFVALVRSLCKPDGTPLFPDIETAMQLQPWLALPLIEAVDKLQRDLPNASTPRTNSGASSPSPSGEEASVSGSSA